MQTPILNVIKIEDMLDRRGRPVKWQETIICSCWNSDSGSPDYTCLACHGKGHVYQTPIESKALITSITLSKDFAEMAGVFEVGDAVMTVPKRIPIRHPVNGMPTGQHTNNPIFGIGMYDKITLLDDDFKSSEVLVKSTPINARPPDTLLNTDVTRIRSIQKYDSSTGDVALYTLGVDFEMLGNVVSWLEDGLSPETGEQYSVAYYHRPTYVVTATLPKPRHQDGQDFPRYVALRYLSGGVERVV